MTKTKEDDDGRAWFKEYKNSQLAFYCSACMLGDLIHTTNALWMPMDHKYHPGFGRA